MKHQQPPEEDILDRPPIANTEIEAFVLGAAMKYPKLADEAVDRLLASDFTVDKHRLVFERIKDLRAMRIHADKMMIAETLISRGLLEQVTLTFLVDLEAKAPALVSLTAYINVIKEKADLRRVVEVAHLVIEDAYTGTNPKELLRGLETRIYKATTTATQGRVTRLGDDIEGNYAEWIDPKSHAKGSPIPTGFKRLDDLTGGQFHEEIWIWGASTGVGKTSIMLQIALNSLTLEPQIPVLIYSPEMSKQSLYRRLVCQQAMVSVKRFRTGDLSPKERDKIRDATEFVMKLPLYIDSSGHLTVADMRLRTRRAMEDHGIRWAGIDFIQKVRPINSRLNAREAMNEISNEMIEIAKETVPFHIMSQLNNDHRKTRGEPTLGSLKESSNLAEIAHVTIAPYREAMEPGKKGTVNQNEAKFLVLKNREGELAKIPMEYVGWRMMYRDTADYAPPLPESHTDEEEPF